MITYTQLKEKLLGCWNGKNIGGALGAPFEAKRGVFDVTYYTKETLENPPPNDDLDLQLVWLNAVEKFGKFVNSEILGEYWLTYIIPDWVEYGSGKTNLRSGLLPPLSGYVDNAYRNSCGAFIRSEIWASLSPGHPEIATVYAYRDAVVDHADEGMYGEVFLAAVQSAAFFESDVNLLLDIGLSYIPKDCLIAKTVALVRKLHKSGVSWQKARESLMREIPGNFGIQYACKKDVDSDYPLAEPGMDAPNNIGIMLIGWLYGNNDFGKSICIAVGCGEDADCSAASLGALLGIINGNGYIPKEWSSPINGKITTVCINVSDMLIIPKTVDELVQRILNVIPSFINHHNYHSEPLDLSYSEDRFCIYAKGEQFEDNSLTGKIDLFREDDVTGICQLIHLEGELYPRINELIKAGPFTVVKEFPTFNAFVDYGGVPEIAENETKHVKLTLYGYKISKRQRRFGITVYGSDGVEFPVGRFRSCILQTKYKDQAIIEFDIAVSELKSDHIDVLVDIAADGRHTDEIIKLRFFAKNM